MRLIHTTNLTLHEFANSDPPAYVILSHCWANDEISLQDFLLGTKTDAAGYKKISDCCRLAREDGIDYAWLDTFCIDKTSSAELSEAINSMFRWYERSKICYAFLADVELSDESGGLPSMERSRWFTRGWTLQELLAPSNIVFYDKNLRPIGTRESLRSNIAKITGIEERFLYPGAFRHASVAQRMSWASSRQTTRIEDMAYCLMGLFDIKMPLLYGEGRMAFMRLQEQILAQSTDESIFAWVSSDRGYCGLLAEWPSDFSKSGKILQSISYMPRPSYTMTNKGLDFHIPSICGHIWGSELLSYFQGALNVPLDCEYVDTSAEHVHSDSSPDVIRGRNVSVKLRRISALGDSIWVRANPSELSLHRDRFGLGRLSVILHGYNTIYLPQLESHMIEIGPRDNLMKTMKRTSKNVLLTPATIAASPASCTLIFMLWIWWYEYGQLDSPAFTTWLWLTWGWKLCRYSDMYLFVGAGLLLFRPKTLTLPRLQVLLIFMSTLLVWELAISAGVQMLMRKGSLSNIGARSRDRHWPDSEVDGLSNGSSILLSYRASSDATNAWVDHSG